jgi:hypothetical protein
VYLDAGAPIFYVDWERVANDAVAILRAEAGREATELVADPGLTMFVYTAEPGSKSEQALKLLASWTATPDKETTHADHEEQSRHQPGA